MVVGFMDYGLWGLWIMVYGLCVGFMDYGLWLMDYGVWARGCGRLLFIPKVDMGSNLTPKRSRQVLGPYGKAYEPTHHVRGLWPLVRVLYAHGVSPEQWL